MLGLEATESIQESVIPVAGPIEPSVPVVFNALAVLIWLALFANAGLYDSRRLVNASEELRLALQAVAVGSVAATFAALVLDVPT